MRKFMLVRATLLALLVAPQLHAAADDPLARRIMERVEQRDDGEQVRQVMQMLLVNNRGNERRRVMRMDRRDLADGVVHRLALAMEPADVRNTGFLSYEYPDEEDEQWLYLPALAKVKRIPRTDRADGFLGSDFSYADLERMKIDRYRLQLLGEEVLRGHDVWRIEAVPLGQEERDATGYSAVVLYVRKDIDFVVRRENTLERPGHDKVMDVFDVQQIDGVWLARRLQMVSRRNGAAVHKTVIEVLEANLDMPFSDDHFSQRALRRGL